MTRFLSFTMDTPSGVPAVYETIRGTRSSRKSIFAALRTNLKNGNVTKVRVERTHSSKAAS